MALGGGREDELGIGEALLEYMIRRKRNKRGREKSIKERGCKRRGVGTSAVEENESFFMRWVEEFDD